MKKIIAILLLMLIASPAWAIPPFPPSAGSGDMTEATYVTGGKIKTSTGGTGQDSSAWTGCFPYLLTGTWSCDGNTTKELRLMGAQAVNADLTTIAALTCGENQILKMNGADAWACAADATGGVDVSGTPTNHQWGVWTDNNTQKGMTVTASKVACSNADGDPVACTNLTDTAPHDAVTLAGTPETNVFSLSTQALSLDTQTANYLFAGPTTGAAAAPTFRAMVNADIPTTLTPQVARIGVGQAADGTNPIASSGFSVDPDGDVTAKSYGTTRGDWPGYNMYYEPTSAGDSYWKDKTDDNMSGTVINIWPRDTGAVGQHQVIVALDTDNQTNSYAYSNTIRITQNTHGFAVGDVVKRSGSAYAKAQADSAANAEVVGIVSAAPTANTFDLTSHGYVTGLTGLTDGTLYYLSPSSAGALTATQPSTTGQVIKPVLIATATTAGYFNNMRGTMVSVSGAPFIQTDNATTVACGGYYISSTNKVFQLPTPSSGCEVCVKNIQGGTNTINLSVGTGIYLEETDGSAYCTATYNLISSGANGDQICVVGLDATHWTTWSSKGTWVCTDNAS